MKKAALLLAGLLLSVSFAYAQPDFITGTEDIPYMEGLTPIDSLSFSFDTPQGRIVQSVQETKTISQAKIEAFYRDSLSSLGWTAKGKNSYARDGEKLDIRFDKKGQTLTIRFDLTNP